MIEKTMTGMYVALEVLETTAKQLDREGKSEKARQLRKQAFDLGTSLLNIEGILQEAEEAPAAEQGEA
ncbi:hypothetical protein ACM26W_01155 [Halomonas sp. HK25]|uniref:hypothetical protein n=1 Tax=Halomonas sp. HK25 TaxID=3394321 RepID=UPI0039FD9A59